MVKEPLTLNNIYPLEVNWCYYYISRVIAWVYNNNKFIYVYIFPWIWCQYYKEIKYIYKKVNLFYLILGFLRFINYIFFFNFFNFFYMACATMVWAIKIREIWVKDKKILNKYRVVL